jgi:glycine cleavage system aminomethyltransferase T
VSLAFLTPGDAAISESPLAPPARRDGATLDLRDGWLVPVRFTSIEEESAALDQTLGWGDASPLGKFELHGATDAAPGSARREEGRWCCPVAPGLTLVLGAPAPGDHALDVTTQYAALVVAGPLARETIARFCAIDLRDAVAGTFRPGSIARTPGHILCEGPDRFLLLFGAALSEYMWTVVSDAGRSLGGSPVGWDALKTAPAAGPAREAARA